MKHTRNRQGVGTIARKVCLEWLPVNGSHIYGRSTSYVDILLNCLVVKHAHKIPPSPRPLTQILGSISLQTAIYTKEQKAGFPLVIVFENQWLNGGQVEINDDNWHEICGSSRIEKKPTGKVMVYVQAPALRINAYELLKFCEDNNIGVHGHCVFWEVEDIVPDWVKRLSRNDLVMAVHNRLNGLFNRYRGKFKHYDVNNEMLHGSFYKDRLGKNIRGNVFKEAKRLDPSSILFMNDYHVEDGCDTRSSPEKYVEQILDLQEQGAVIGGIGIQLRAYR
ncbi:hypothetical protein QVD17_38300 [Tagetes erecta]|uniref:GH10 domain-containing protein n=1 Tax=Tagetes erecta TaxID=13708 RepID=A0AAD8JQB0_TARER|nr:hypothetical protein QVD17_38300 [Tagetes erecta]